ncbi:hypothetical protein IHE45_19G140500 [Dioscorea alata]|uniref:Uncharacterized protein n=1 Tax=Dioscorea alata TaxID=55571 RepID=A0ACB7U296_DIOAL|nr:hypothetical protein IHE45_19G140500 [Dioscorea alata]
MCSIGVSVEELLGHSVSAAEDIILYRETQRLRLLMIASGYYDNEQNFKREILTPKEHMYGSNHWIYLIQEKE